MKSIFCCLVLSIGLPFGLSITAQAQAPIGITSHNDVQRVDETHFKTGDTDPYWIFENLNIEADKRILELPISLSIPQSAQVNLNNIRFELFFRATDNEGSSKFDPLYKVQYLFSAESFNKPLSISLVLPDAINYQGNSKLRLDIDRCAGCELSFTGEQIGEQSKDAKNIELLATSTINGARSVPEQSIVLNTTDWRLNDLERITPNSDLANLDVTSLDVTSLDVTGLDVTGLDPYLVSPPLTINTATLGGVLVELSVTNSADSSLRSQLFYSTEQHRFKEQASTIVELANDDSNIEQTFFIPLDFISSQAPVMQMLTGLRLDINQAVSINKISLVNKQAAKKYQTLIPKRIYQRKIQGASGQQIIAGIFGKLGKDPGFIIIYGLLLILVAVLFRRAYK